MSRRAVIGLDPGKRRDRAGLCVMWVDDHVPDRQTRELALFGAGGKAIGVQPWPGETKASHWSRVQRVQADDASAIATALEVNERGRIHRRRGDIVHVELLPLGTPYPEIARRVQREMQNPSLETNDGGPLLVFDQGGVGEALNDIFAELGIRERRGIWCTAASEKSHFDNRYTWFVTKAELVTTTQVALERDPPDLKAVQGIPAAAQLRDELLAYRVTESPSGRDKYGAAEDSREDERRVNDDLLSAVFVAWWFGSKKLHLHESTGADYPSYRT